MQAAAIGSGDVLDGKYRILTLLGRGGMGAVYAATRLSLGDTVAVKLLLPNENGEAARARFLREAQAAARIRHPSIVQVFDYGDPPDGEPYIVMEYLEGPTLAEMIHARGRLPVEEAFVLFGEVCAAVDAGHQRGVVHRDLKPGNVIVARSDGGGEVAKVLDFGIASIREPVYERDAPIGPAVTQPGALVGTFEYMAPGQIRGLGAAPADDVFALGVLLYEMVTGSLPFAARTPIDSMMRILAGDFTPPELHVPSLPTGIGVALRSALSVDPAARPASAEALARLAGASSATRRRAPSTGAGIRPPAGVSVRPPSQATTASPASTMRAVILHAQASAPALDHFVGRAQELARLDEQRRAAMAGRGRLTLVTGEAGVGKTRLVEVFVRAAADRGDAVLWAKFFDYEGSRRPSCESIAEMLGLDLARDEGAPGTAEPDAAREHDRGRLFPRIEAALARLAEAGPLVLVFDDVQWASPLDLDLLVYLYTATLGRRVLFVATVRGDGRAEEGALGRFVLALAEHRASAVVPVRALTEDEVREWLAAGFGGLRVRPQDLRRLARATGGNPYCLVEVVRHLMTTGAIRADGDAWACAALDEVTLPETVQGLVRANLGGIGEELRGVLEVAAALGYELRFDTLRAAVGLDEDALEALIERAVKLRLLSEAAGPPGDDLRFSSDTIRSVLYEGMSARRQRRVHQKVVGALHALYPGTLRRNAAVLCYHHHAIGAWAEALAWGLDAAEDALARHENDGAEISLSRAAEAAAAMSAAGEPARAPDHARLDRLTGALYVRLGRFDEAVGILAPRAAEDDRVLLDLAQAELGRGGLDVALRVALEAGEAARRGGDAGRALAADTLAASLLGRLGRGREGLSLLAERIDAAGDAAPSVEASLAQREHAMLAALMGDFALAEQRARRALELARRAGDVAAQYATLSALAAVLGEAGEAASAIPIHLEALALSRALSLRRREGIELANLGEAEYFTGDLASALERFREALAIFLEIKDRACEGDVRVNLGRTLLSAGSRVEAVRMLEQAREIRASTGRAEYEGLASLHLGEAHLADGRLDDAAASLDAARRIFVAQTAHHAWRAEVALARLAHARGDAIEAAERAREAEARLGALQKAAGPGGGAPALARALADVRAFVESLERRSQP